MAKFGHISLELQGTRPDGIAFEDTASFKFTPVTAEEVLNTNSVGRKEIEEGVFEYTFLIKRFLSTPDELLQASTIYWNLNIIDPGEASQTLNVAYIEINDYAVIGEDNKYFVMTGGYTPLDVEVSDFEISDVTYDTTTNNLTFSYSLLASASVNDSGNDLNISGTVDVIVLEEIISF